MVTFHRRMCDESTKGKPMQVHIEKVTDRNGIGKESKKPWFMREVEGFFLNGKERVYGRLAVMRNTEAELPQVEQGKRYEITLDLRRDFEMKMRPEVVQFVPVAEAK